MSISSCLSRLNPATNRWIWWALLLIGIVPVVMAFEFTCLIPRCDHWNVICQPYIQYADGGSLWEFLHSPGTDSRHNAPKLLHLALIKLTGWNLVYESLICVAQGIGTCALLNSLWRRHEGINGIERWCLALVCTALLLSPMQWMNWAWGIQICYTMNVFCSLAVIWIFSLSGKLLTRTLWAALMAILASFSFLSGLLSWGMGLLFLLHAGAGQRWRGRGFLISLGLWAALAILTVAVYRSGWPEGKAIGAAGGVEIAESHPWQLGHYMLRLLGAPSGQFGFFFNRQKLQEFLDVSTPIIGGGMVLTLLLVTFHIWKKRRQLSWGALLPWCLLCLWGLANVAAIAFARIGMADFAPYQSRYPAYSLWMNVGLLGLLASLKGWAFTWLRWGWVAVFVVGGTFGAIQGWRDASGRTRENQQLETAVIMRRVTPEPVLLDGVIPSGQARIVKMLDRLDQLGIIRVPTFSSDLVNAARQGSDKEYRGELRSGKWTENGLYLRGWSIHRTSRLPAPAVLISMEAADGIERWIGIASELKRDSLHTARYRAKAPDDRVAWAYEPLTGEEKCFMSKTLISTKRNPLPAGDAKFRAYAVEPSTGIVHRIPGEVKVTIP